MKQQHNPAPVNLF